MSAKRISSALVIGLVVAGCGSGGGAADQTLPLEPVPDSEIGAELMVTIEHPDADTIEYRIVCDTETSSVIGADGVDAGAACDRLSNPLVQSRLIDGPPAGLMCTEIYGGPDVATIEGSIDGVEVLATIDRTNGCGIGDWDELLRGVLPPALGVMS